MYINNKEFHKKYSNTAAIAASAKWRNIIDRTDRDEYGYFNDLTVHNDSNSPIYIEYDFDTNKRDKVPANSIFILSHKEGTRFNHISIVNIDSVNAIAIDEIIPIVRKVVVKYKETRSVI